MKSRPSERVKMPPGFWTGISRLGIAATDVARMAQLPVTITTEATVTTAQYFAIWQAYSELAGDLAPGITRLAAAFDTAQYPPAVLATYHARDYRDALHRMVRYKQMCPPESLRMTEENGQCTIELEWGDTGQPGRRCWRGSRWLFSWSWEEGDRAALAGAGSRICPLHGR